jgi:hypothetical protein
MARRRRPHHPPEPEPPLYWGLTPNQIVAYNLHQARLWRGWTQEQSAEALEPYLGARWSKTVFSTAERSVDGDRIRQFDADEIVALARGFDLPVTWFFLPPPPQADGRPVTLDTPDSRDRYRQPLATLVDLVFGTPEQAAAVALRMQAFLADVSDDLLTAAQQAVTSLADQRVTGLVGKAIGKLGRWHTQLHNIANQLEDLEVQARQVVAVRPADR